MIDKLIKVEEAELDYLEKESNKDLDSKTKNAGDNNYTKYARDLIEWVGSPFMQAQPWCVMIQVWCFIVVFGVEGAKKLLHVWTMSCGTLMDAFKRSGEWVTEDPQVGDFVIFQWYKTEKGKKKLCRHIGWIYRVDKNYIYTIEGNTSCHDKDVIENGGGVFKKSYPKTHPKIKGYCRPAYVEVALPVLNRRQQTAGKNDKRQCKLLQQNLNSLGYKGKDGNKLAVDGSFGANTEYAVKDFQKVNGLAVDGSYGPRTAAMLYSILSEEA